ncbi:hypothetical protein HY990_06950 [Candidatus Micrarchaeota archaeon]|nr:hypothetical protein [Candidatus Micrarchaeota archaeon]
MVSKETQDLSQLYCERHKVHESEIGFRPFLLGGRWELFLTPVADLFFAFTAGAVHRDCMSIAMALYDDILEHHPQLAPTVLQFLHDGNTQNYVQITCPETGEKINLDTTPWASDLHTPYPTGVPAPIAFEDLGVPLRFDRMIPHSVSRNKEFILTTNISSWLPAADPNYLFGGADFVVMFTFSKQYSIDRSELSPYRLVMLVRDVDNLVASDPDRNDSIALLRSGVLRLGILNLSSGSARLESLSPHRLDDLHDIYDLYDNRTVGSAAKTAIRDAHAIFRKLKPRMPVLGSKNTVDVRSPYLPPLEALFIRPNYERLCHRARSPSKTRL